MRNYKISCINLIDFSINFFKIISYYFTRAFSLDQSTRFLNPSLYFLFVPRNLRSGQDS